VPLIRWPAVAARRAIGGGSAVIDGGRGTARAPTIAVPTDTRIRRRGAATVNRVLTVGVDLAAADQRTAIAAVEWSPSGAEVRDVAVGVGDDRIVEAFATADKVGIDCPVGWPVPFVELVAGRSATPADTGATWRHSLAWRTTDDVVWKGDGILPLSVSADRIAHAAFRCAGILARLDQPLDGSGVLAEVYPAAALKRWGIPYKGLKATGVHDVIVDALKEHEWLDLGVHEDLMRRSRDATDAVVAAPRGPRRRARQGHPAGAGTRSRREVGRVDSAAHRLARRSRPSTRPKIRKDAAVQVSTEIAGMPAPADRVADVVAVAR
jgi:predicted nuclease with RNAse H fold